MNNIPDTSLILVAVLTKQKDLDIARLLGWYRIPLRSSPKVIAVDYLAFYQTASFSENERWKINYIAEVKGHELATRGELLKDEPEHPHAHEEYFKIQIGPLVKLKASIITEKWHRITFFYTTGAYLNRAKLISDLIVENEERQVLWQALRERALCKNQYHAEKLPEIPIDSVLLKLLGL